MKIPKTELTNIVEKLKKSVEDKNLSSIDTVMEEINSKWQEVSTQLYQETQENEPDVNTTENSDTTDVEFEEVK